MNEMVFQCALIGCGRIGCGFDDNSQLIRTHAGAYYNNSRTSLVALCDIDENKLSKYGKKYPVVNLYQDYKEMLRHEKLDLISICTLVDSHYTIISEAAKYGVKGIFLEKPMADTLFHAKKIIEICNKNDISLLIDYQRRFIPVYYKIKDYILSGNLGKIQKIIVYYGAGIANTGSHIFDLLYFLFGSVRSIYAKSSPNSSHTVIDPNLDVELVFTNGISCSIISFDVTHYGILEMEIFGSSGRLFLDMGNHEVNHFVVSKKDSLVYRQLVPKKFPNTKKIDEPIVKGLKNLLECVQTKKKSLCDGKDGYISLELVMASLISASKNKEISLPLSTLNYSLQSK